MKLDPAAFNRHLKHVGQRLLWRQSFMCPCVIEFSGAADTSCTLCHGKGRMWNAPVESVAGVTRQGVDSQFQDFGAMEQGDLTLTVPNSAACYDMGKFDRITLLNSTDVFSRVLTRGDNDRLLDIPVQSVTRVFWRNAAKTGIVEGGIPTVGEGGALTWASGEPDAGVQYSITGIKFDEYYVYSSLPSDRNEHQGAALPKRVALRKFDLFGK